MAKTNKAREEAAEARAAAAAAEAGDEEGGASEASAPEAPRRRARSEELFAVLDSAGNFIRVYDDEAVANAFAGKNRTGDEGESGDTVYPRSVTPARNITVLELYRPPRRVVGEGRAPEDGPQLVDRFDTATREDFQAAVDALNRTGLNGQGAFLRPGSR